MPRLKKEHPVDETVKKADAPKEEAPKDLGRLGSANRSLKITGGSRKIVNGRLLFDVHCEDGTTYLLDEASFKAQFIAPPKE
jgi:hypothetical protein